MLFLNLDTSKPPSFNHTFSAFLAPWRFKNAFSVQRGEHCRIIDMKLNTHDKSVMNGPHMRNRHIELVTAGVDSALSPANRNDIIARINKPFQNNGRVDCLGQSAEKLNDLIVSFLLPSPWNLAGLSDLDVGRK